MCNHFEEMYVIHRRWYVINPKEKNIQVLRLDDIPFALQTDYIRLTAITYQYFGLDEKSRSEERDFLVGVTGFEPAASSSQNWRATNCATPRFY